jgi:hypothetical protein
MEAGALARGQRLRRDAAVELAEARLGWLAPDPTRIDFCRHRAAFRRGSPSPCRDLPVGNGDDLCRAASPPTPAAVCARAHVEIREDLRAIDPASPVSISEAGSRPKRIERLQASGIWLGLWPRRPSIGHPAPQFKGRFEPAWHPQNLKMNPSHLVWLPRRWEGD